MSSASDLAVHVLRLKPGDEMLSALCKYKAEQCLQAPFIMTCCGSLTKATLRMAAHTASSPNNDIKELDGPFEIVSLVGTLSSDTDHLHIALSDKDGRVIGGHVIGGLHVFTTAEIVIGECRQLVLDREVDSSTGFPELVIRQRESL